MDLTKVLSKKNSDHKDYYWSVAIEPDWVQVGLWYSEGDSAYIVSSSTPTAWQSEKDLIDAVDAALSYVVQNTIEEIGEPSKTVFGVIDSWVEGGQIKNEHLDKIKKICQELSLTPTGFVVISEAIANFIKSTEGSPLTGIVLGISKEFISITLFKVGNVAGHAQVARSPSIVDDTVEGLTRIVTSEPAPSRFIIYNAKKDEIEEAWQSLIKAQWEDYETLSFLHTPKVEMINSDKKIEAVSLGGASDISKASRIVSISEKTDDMDNLEVNEETQKVTDSIEGKDYTDPEDLGFAIGKDVADEELSEQAVLDYSPEVTERIENQQTEETPKPKKELSIKPTPFLGIFSKLKKPSILKDSGTGRKVIFIGLGVLLVIFVLGFAAWWVIPRATITMYLSTQKLDERLSITVDPDINEADIGNGILPGTILTKDLQGSKTKSTTGTRTVGERATGEITLYRVGSSIVIDEGTEIVGTQNLRFTLDEEVEVASGSAVTPGTVNVKVTASDIGSDYNLAEDTTFSVGNYSSSSIGAKNESPFSGGSSREINAVSESDQQDLESDLNEELESRALRELSDELETSTSCNDCKLVPESYSVLDSVRDYSAKVGDEGDNLSLNLSLKAQVIALSEEDLMGLSKEILNERVPRGYVLRDDQIDTSFEFIEEDSGTYKFSVSVLANLFPEVDVLDVVRKITGKYPEVAKDYFTKEIPGFVRAEISMQPRLPGKLATLPHMAKKIEIILTSGN